MKLPVRALHNKGRPEARASCQTRGMVAKSARPSNPPKWGKSAPFRRPGGQVRTDYSEIAPVLRRASRAGSGNGRDIPDGVPVTGVLPLASTALTAALVAVAATAVTLALVAVAARFTRRRGHDTQERTTTLLRELEARLEQMGTELSSALERA